MSDITVYEFERTEDGARQRWIAWQSFSPDGRTCRFCPHTGRDHGVATVQPHFFRPATEQDRSAGEDIYDYKLPGYGTVAAKREVVAEQIEFRFIACFACARAMDADQVICYTEPFAIGELVGFGRPQMGSATPARPPGRKRE